mmetsp:Transcript_26096/g.77780  ORF Transcript_26096/g.77780 Transcript_26096/m.77780 type:complete len:418 (-) Transcript_26096:273-1526(-)
MWTTEVLGEGANGSVVRAVERATRRKVAVKSFANRRLTRLQKKDIEREIAILSRLDHPKVVRLEAVYRSEKFTRLVLEDLEGGDVFQSIEESGRVDEAQAALVIRQLLQAVEHLHDSGVVHRDIKLENIVYESDRRDKVKLIDFGLCSRWAEGKKPLRRSCGTLAYLPPEMTRGAYTNKADLWCVGTAAYTMLTGEKLLRNENWGPVYTETFSRCSKGAKQFVAALLSADPDLRPCAREALQHRWLLEADANTTFDNRKETNLNMESLYSGSDFSSSSCSLNSVRSGSKEWFPQLSKSISANFQRDMPRQLTKNISDNGGLMQAAIETCPLGLYRQKPSDVGADNEWESERAKRKSFLGNPFRRMTLGSNVIAPVSALVASLRSKTKGNSRIVPQEPETPAMPLPVRKTTQIMTTTW